MTSVHEGGSAASAAFCIRWRAGNSLERGTCKGLLQAAPAAKLAQGGMQQAGKDAERTGGRAGRAQRTCWW